MKPSSSGLRTWFQGSLFLLPYASYLGFVGLLGGMVAAVRSPHPPLSSRLLQFFALLTGLLILSCALAYDRAEAFLQLGNFLPFFAFFLIVPLVFRRPDAWYRTALGLVLTMLPLNLLSLGEYVLKSPNVPRSWLQLSWIRSIHLAPHRFRAMVTFDHPNAFASYLVVVLGLGLGLLLYHLTQRSPGRSRFNATTLWLLAAIFSCLLGIFASGSRNGLLVALTQLGLFLLCSPLNRTILLSGVGGLVALVGGALTFGVGGRSLSLAGLADDPRVGVWRVAWELIQERPWFGWGLGNYKIAFPPRTFDPVDYANVNHPHNIFLMLAAETGVFVLILAVLGVGYCGYRAVRVGLSRTLEPTETYLLLAYLLGFWGSFAYSLLDITFYDGRVNTLNWLMLAGLYWFGHRVHVLDEAVISEEAIAQETAENMER